MSTANDPPSRRDFFHWVSDGIYGAALTSLLCEDLYGGANALRPGAVAEPASGPRREYDLKPRQPPFRAQGQGGHPAFDEWRTEPDGSV